jgi:hypothetical protein
LVFPRFSIISEAVAAMRTSNDPRPEASTDPAREVHRWVIIKKHKTLQMHLLRLSTTQTGVTVLHDLWKKYESTKPT